MAVTWAAQKQRALLKGKWRVEGQPRESASHSRAASSKSLKRLLCECISAHTYTHIQIIERYGGVGDGIEIGLQPPFLVFSFF